MCDDVFDDDSDDKVLRFQELDRIQRSRKLEGYREGVIAGKEESLQDGFDDGFRDAFAAMSHLGRLQGTLSALLSVQSIAKCQVAPPGDVGEIESLQREVSEFEERTRTFINTTESRLLALPVDGNMDDSSGLFIPVDGSTVGVEGSSLAGGNNPLINFAKGKVSTLECDNHEKRIVSKVSSYTTYEKSVGASMAQPSEKNVGASIAPPGEKSVHASLAPPGDCQEKSLPLNETVLRVVSTNDKAEYDVNTLNAVKTQMREMNCDVIDLTKITFLETECNRILEKFGLSDLLV